MARIRTIKPEFWNDEKLATISRDARLTFIGTWNQSDDYGVVKGNHAWLKNTIFPYDETLKLSDFKKWLQELEAIKTIIPFQVNSESYYFITHFNAHQKINRPSIHRNPEPPEDILSRKNENSGSPHGAVTEDSCQERKGREGKGKEGNECSHLFEKFWTAYPTRHGKKVGRAKALELFTKANGDREQIIKAAENYAKSSGAKDGYVKDPERFLKNEFWRDWLEPEPPPRMPDDKRKELQAELAGIHKKKARIEQSLDYYRSIGDAGSIAEYEARLQKYQRSIEKIEKDLQSA